MENEFKFYMKYDNYYVLGKNISMNDKQKIVSNADTSYGNEHL